MTRNDHFLKLCQEVQLVPPVSDEKWSLSQAMSRSSVGTPVSEVSTGGAKRGVEKTPNLPTQTESWPENPIIGLIKKTFTYFRSTLSRIANQTRALISLG